MDLTPEQFSQLEKGIKRDLVKDEDLALLDSVDGINAKMDAESARKEEMHAEMMDCLKTLDKEMPEIPEVVFPEVQKVEVLNFPEQKAPIVNVTPPSPVIVPAPEVTVEKTEVKFPEVQKVEVQNSQFTLVDEEGKVIDLKQLGEYIGKNIKVVGGGGGGLGAFSTYGVSKDISITDQLKNYFLTDIDDTTSTEYYGYVDKNGAWYIKQVTSTAVRFAKGSSDYTTSWGNRAVSVSYDYFNLTF